MQSIKKLIEKKKKNPCRNIIVDIFRIDFKQKPGLVAQLKEASGAKHKEFAILLRRDFSMVFQ